MSDVTVIIPTLSDRQVLLRRALKSIRKQTVPQDTISTIVEVDENKEGAAATRNKAIEKIGTSPDHPQTEWIAFLDDDDEFLPMHLEILLGAAKEGVTHPDGKGHPVDLVYTYPMFIGIRDTLAVSHNGEIAYPYGVPFGEEQEKYLRTVGNFIPVTHLCRTSLVKEVGGFPEQNSFEVPEGNNSGDCEDYGLLLRLLDAGGQFLHVPEVTWRYHVHGNNTGGAA